MRAGDYSGYEELYRRHVAALTRYARTCCRDVHTADDLAAEVFVRLLQVVRRGAGPEHAVRAYLWTTVRRVAAEWTRAAQKEHLVADFAVFVEQAPSKSAAVRGGGVAPGADVLALREVERSTAARAFRSLSERWQTVLWYTEVEGERPQDVAPRLGLNANATRVLASRAREGLRQAYVQEHVSAARISSGRCAPHAARLGRWTRGLLRIGSERRLSRHLARCGPCRSAASQIEELASDVPGPISPPVGGRGPFLTAAPTAGCSARPASRPPTRARTDLSARSGRSSRRSGAWNSRYLPRTSGQRSGSGSPLPTRGRRTRRHGGTRDGSGETFIDRCMGFGC
ncbi:RNA polymerase sigma factor [Streptomyces sp. NPDC127068]|uniref:RNA polymerase sigma factor n=1 Tax=Streptomyces sp. NPDC127068 TaxID=3347127 RepID=UPI003664A1CD